ncbi:TrmB family transcriptional regulator [Halorussus halophilus]|uniref:TrmB family transcriptional regulator n=1 Tax=Halorussus halophilus TaxID=2650975 RepID=UPI0013014042|nr:TrmB family transcriptional regulator [Halorussus halophilus]
MSVQRPTTSTEPLPNELDSPRAKLVYLYLSTERTAATGTTASDAGGASIDELQSQLDLQKITLYSILRTLRERNLVEKRGDSFAVAE